MRTNQPKGEEKENNEKQELTKKEENVAKGKPAPCDISFVSSYGLFQRIKKG